MSRKVYNMSTPTHHPRSDQELTRDALRDYAAREFIDLATKVRRYASAADCHVQTSEALRCVELSESA